MHKSVITRRVYDWESEYLIPISKFVDSSELRKLLKRVAKDYNVKEPRLRFPKNGNHSYCLGDKIAIVKKHKKKLILLHEMAHYIQGDRGHDHGPAFVRRYIELLKRYLGWDADLLMYQAKNAKVKL